jgi:hypothetical protein
MAKPNIHTASREELVEAGVRSDLVTEILKLRRKGTVEFEALDALPGVGPVTLEQLRQSLDFSDKAPSNGNGNGDARAAKSTVSSVRTAKQPEAEQPEESGTNEAGSSVKIARQSAEDDTNRTTSSVKVARQPAEGSADEAAAAGSAVRNAAEAATRSTAEAGARVTSIAARSGLETIQRTARTATEAGQETMSRATQGTTDLGQMLTELWKEQTRHNLEAMTAFGRAVNWTEVVRVQGQFVRASFERMTQMNRSYLKIVQSQIIQPHSQRRQ